MPYPTHLLPAAVMGSVPQPAWLVPREHLQHRMPCVREPEIWRMAWALRSWFTHPLADGSALA